MALVRNNNKSCFFKKLCLLFNILLPAGKQLQIFCNIQIPYKSNNIIMIMIIIIN